MGQNGHVASVQHPRHSSEKSVYIEAYVGARYLPSDVEMAVMSMVAEIAELEGQPKTCSRPAARACNARD